MRNSESRISGDMIYAKTIAFVNLCRALKETHFTRIRKMSLDNLMLSVLFRKGRTLHMELRSFKKPHIIFVDLDSTFTFVLYELACIETLQRRAVSTSVGPLSNHSTYRKEIPLIVSKYVDL